jgi:hypothetical protein
MKQKYRTRDPQLITRDPEPQQAIPKPLPRALLIEAKPITCTRCGGGKFYRNNATRPNKTADMMTRRKQCLQCGQWYVVQSEPTQQERAKYW